MLMEIAGTEYFSFFQNELRAFIYKRVKNKALADDLAQDVYLKAQSRLHQLEDDGKMKGWIYQITRNLITDHFRRLSRAVPAAELEVDSEAPNFNACVASSLKSLLPTLPAKYREALELTELQNVSQLELAERLGISYSGAKSRVQRARTMLKEKLHKVLTVQSDAYGNIIVCRGQYTPCCCC